MSITIPSQIASFRSRMSNANAIKIIAETIKNG